MSNSEYTELQRLLRSEIDNLLGFSQFRYDLLTSVQSLQHDFINLRLDFRSLVDRFDELSDSCYDELDYFESRLRAIEGDLASLRGSISPHEDT